MSEQENLQIVRRLFDNLNKHNLDANNQLYAKDVRTEAAGVPSALTSRDQGQSYVRQFLEAFPDLHFDIRDTVAQGNMVAVSWTSKGRHSKPLNTMDGGSIPATNKSATISGCTMVEIRNNLITRQGIYWDQVSLFSQLGISMEMMQVHRSG